MPFRIQGDNAVIPSLGSLPLCANKHACICLSVCVHACAFLCACEHVDNYVRVSSIEHLQTPQRYQLTLAYASRLM